MTYRDARMLFDFWQDSPPENEMLVMFARIYTTWKPKNFKELTPEEQQDAHRKSLEERWAAGAMNPKQMFEAMGGAVSLTPNGYSQTGARITAANMPGIGPFPGAH
jgi:hypothetical protein